jgi:glycosyltransferase involved in cell wall biosynthesis
LAIVGGVFENRRAQAQAAVVKALAAADPDGIQHVSEASDTEVAALFAEARATLYLSDAEGYGLPPIEGLAAGIPTVVGGEVPSVTELPPRGWARLPTLNVEALVEVVKQLNDDDRASALWAEAAALDLPTWRGFGTATAAWLQGTDPVSRPITDEVHAVGA